jgi:chitin disaccharide deacetylase
VVKRLIVTADDFGLTVPVNEAIEAGHRRGILTAASLMVAGEAAEDAVMRARGLPELGVGLHLVLVDGAPMLPPEQIPDLVDARGLLRSNVVAQGVRIFCSAAARRQAAAEIRAQLSAFRRTGLLLDHVNAHHHFHLHPTVQRVLLQLAPEFGIRAVRVPFEPLSSARRSGLRGAAWLDLLMTGRRARRLQHRLRRAGLAANDRVFGLAASGAMVSATVQRYLEALPDGVSEIYFHPATEPPAVWPASYQARSEFEALIDPASAAIVARRGIERVTFAALDRVR